MREPAPAICQLYAVVRSCVALAEGDDNPLIVGSMLSQQFDDAQQHISIRYCQRNSVCPYVHLSVDNKGDSQVNGSMYRNTCMLCMHDKVMFLILSQIW